MEQTDIFAPFVGTMLLTAIVWIYMYSRRLPFVLSRKLSPEQMKRLDGLAHCLERIRLTSCR